MMDGLVNADIVVVHLYTNYLKRKYTTNGKEHDCRFIPILEFPQIVIQR